MNNVSSFPFPFFFFLLQISFNFSILFVSSFNTNQVNICEWSFCYEQVNIFTLLIKHHVFLGGRGWSLLKSSMKRKEMNNVSSFPFPFFFFLLQISFNFSILFVSSERQRLFLTFSFEILRGKFARGRPESIPTRMPNVWPLCYWSQCSILAVYRSWQKPLSRTNATRDLF